MTSGKPNRKAKPAAPAPPIAATFLAMTVLSSGDLIEIIPVFAPFVAGPLFLFMHETHDILAVMLALYAAHKLTPAVGTRAMLWFIALHLPYAYLKFPAALPELTRIALLGAAAFLGIYIISLRKRAEERLRLQATALDAAANAILITNRRGGIEWVNPAFTVLTGYTAEEAIGKNPRALVKSGLHDQAFYKNLWDTILSGQVWRGEIGNRRKDGRLYTEEQTITPVRDGNGAVTHFIAIKQDITERKHAEKRLATQYSVARALAESATLAEASPRLLQAICEGLVWDHAEVWSILWSADSQANVLRCTGTWHPPSLSFPEFETATRQIEFPPGVGLPGRVWASGEPAWIPDVTQDANFPRASIAAKEGLRAGFAFPIQLGGQVLGVMGFLSREIRLPDDDTLQMLTSVSSQISHFIGGKQGEESLRESEERYRTLVETAPDSIFAVSLDGTLVSLNPAFETLTGWPPEEWLGKPFAPFLHPDDLSAAMELFQRILQGETLPPLEWRIRHKSGDYTTVEVIAVPRLGHGQVVGLLGIARDITERKQREREVGAIATVSAALRTVPTRAEMLPVILDQLLNLLRADGALLAMRDATTGETNIVLGRGSAGTSFTGVRLPPGEGVIGQVIATSQPYLNNDVQSDPRFARPDLLPPDIHAVACVPLIVQGQTIGALSLLHAREIGAAEIRLLTAIADIASNAIYRASLHEQTERRLQRLAALRAVDMAISSSLDLRVTLNILLDQSTTHLQVDAADILLFNRYTQTLDYTAGRGFRDSGITRSHLRLGECQAGRAALERRTIYISNLTEETTFVRSGLLANENFAAYYVTPLIAKGEVKGVLEVFHRAPLTSDPEWLDFLEALAGQSSIAIDNAELFDGLQRSNAELTLAYDTTIEGWSRALDLRDKETEGHTQRVTEMTERLVRAMGIGEAEIVHIRRGALLHDIGKMGVPDAILLKPGQLTDEEWVSMRHHPQLAYDMLAPVAYLKPALDIPYCHHEKWDGTGYPRGLKGEQIPLAARIFAVVDVWDALRSDRPYRKGWTEEEVYEYIKAASGTHFDPKVVETFLRGISAEGEVQ